MYRINYMTKLEECVSMTYNEILIDIFNVLEVDYAGAMDKKGWINKTMHLQHLEKKLSEGDFSDVDFIEFVTNLIAIYKDPHMYFLSTDNKQSMDNGFDVRRYQDSLYVTKVWQACGLQVGDMIVSLDDLIIPELFAKHQAVIELYGSGCEREIWHPIIKKYDTCSVMTPSKEIQTIPLATYPKRIHQGEYTLSNPLLGIPVLKLTDFADDNAIAALIDTNEALLENTEQLIIDVRLNKGGSDSAYLKLLPFLFDKDFQLSDLDEATMQLMMTERNYQLRKTEIDSYLSHIEDPAAKTFLESFMSFLESHRDQGLVDVDLAELMPNIPIQTRKGPEKVIVLSDVYCGSSGDSFIDLVKHSDKVTVVGRPTAGITDYSNLATQLYSGKFLFMYPTSRNKQIDQGKGVTGKGHAPDHYIPWTPQHLVKDMDLEYAIQLLDAKI